MNFFKKLFNKKSNDIHFTEKLSISQFFEYIQNNPYTYRNKEMYLYKGCVNELQSIVSSKSHNGEKSINYLSLIYLKVSHIFPQENKLILSDALFIPDIVKELNGCNSNTIAMYHGENGTAKIEYVLICSNDVYFCTK